MPELNLDQLWKLVFFGVPGFVALKTYELLVPGRKTSAQALDVVTYGMLNLLVAWPIFLLERSLGQGVSGIAYTASAIGLTALAVVVSPAALAVAVYKLRMAPWLQKWTLHPLSSAWDFIFQQRREWFLILHLKDGKMVGARFGANSFASDAFNTGEGGPDIYVEETWLLDKNGKFIEKKLASMLIKMSECREIEFFEVQDQLTKGSAQHGKETSDS